jgi:ABC-2 type transport system permease protein
MNIFIREIKVNKWSLLFWSIGMFVFVLAGVMKFSAYENSGQNINQVISQIPKSVQIIVGINVGADVSTARGFYGVLFFYLVLVATVHAALLGAGIISKEERDKTSEFLFVKPVTRAKIISAKLLNTLCNVIVLNFVTLVSSVWLVSKYNKGASATHDIILLMGGMFFLQLIFLALGAAIAGILKKPKGAASLTAVILLFTFILSAFVDIYPKIEKLKYLTPFKYFDAKSITQSGKLDPFYLALSAVIVVVLVATTYLFYTKRDLDI